MLINKESESVEREIYKALPRDAKVALLAEGLVGIDANGKPIVGGDVRVGRIIDLRLRAVA